MDFKLGHYPKFSYRDGGIEPDYPFRFRTSTTRDGDPTGENLLTTCRAATNAVFDFARGSDPEWVVTKSFRKKLDPFISVVANEPSIARLDGVRLRVNGEDDNDDFWRLGNGHTYGHLFFNEVKVAYVQYSH
jgi:hypothetical protein